MNSSEIVWRQPSPSGVATLLDATLLDSLVAAFAEIVEAGRILDAVRCGNTTMRLLYGDSAHTELVQMCEGWRGAEIALSRYLAGDPGTSVFAVAEVFDRARTRATNALATYASKLAAGNG